MARPSGRSRLFGYTKVSPSASIAIARALVSYVLGPPHFTPARASHGGLGLPVLSFLVVISDRG